uniref:Uncharacterized protein n=1 Tax=Leersia perrieri TaxID=77586 RepID=A0A0D9V7Y6_9ORYZ
MVADVDALVTVVVVAVVAAADDDDGATVKLKPPVEEAGTGTENNDPDVAGVAVTDGTADVLAAEADANVGAEAEEDEPNGKLRELADELAAAPVLENNEGAGAACEVAKEKPVDGEDAGVVEAAEVLLGKEKPGAEDAEENNEGVVLAVVVLADEGVKPNDGAEVVVAGEDANPKDGVVVAVVAGDDAVAVLKSGAEVVDPNSAEPVLAPNPRAGEEAEVVVVLDAAAPVFNPKPNDGVDAAFVVVAVLDADEPNPNPVAAPEKRLDAGAEEAAAPNRPGAAGAAAEEAPNGLGVVAAEEAPPNKPGVVAAADEAAPNKPGDKVAPNKPGVVAGEEAAPNKPGVVAAAEVGDAPKMDGAGAAEEAAAVDWPNEKPVDPKPNGDGDEEVAGAAAEAGEDPKREEPNVGAAEAAAEEAEKREEPKAGAEVGAGEEAAAAG